MIHISMPIRTVSEANTREHWGKRSKRAREQRQAAFIMVRNAIGKTTFELVKPIVIKLVRVGKRKLDGDNLSRSFKAIRDGVCDAIGYDDGAECLRFVYGQRKGEYSVDVFIC